MQSNLKKKFFLDSPNTYIYIYIHIYIFRFSGMEVAIYTAIYKSLNDCRIFIKYDWFLMNKKPNILDKNSDIELIFFYLLKKE